MSRKVITIETAHTQTKQNKYKKKNEYRDFEVNYIWK